MKKLISGFILAVIFCVQASAQKKSTDGEILTECICSKLEVYPYLYLENPSSTFSSYILRFDFQHKGVKCTSEFVDSITISSHGRKFTIPVGRLATKLNTINTRQFSIPRDQIGFTISTSRACTITYSLKYGPTSLCPANIKKIIRPTNREPIL